MHGIDEDLVTISHAAQRPAGPDTREATRPRVVTTVRPSGRVAPVLNGTVAARVPAGGDVCHECLQVGPERLWALRWYMPDQVPAVHCARCGAAFRTPFETFDDAAAIANEIRETPGWRVKSVIGEGPAGPPQTSMRHHAVRLNHAPAPSRRPNVVSARVVAINPSGRRTTIGSRGRWLALQRHHAAAATGSLR